MSAATDGRHAPPQNASRRARRLAAASAAVGLARIAWNVVGLAVFAIVVFPGLLDDLDRLQAGRRDQQLHADVVLDRPDARSLPRRDGPPLLLGDGQEQPDRGRRGRRALDGRRVPRRRGAGQVPLHGQQALRRPRHRDPDAPAGGARHPALRRARPLRPDERAHGSRPDPSRDSAAVRDLDAARLHHGDPEGARRSGHGRRLEPSRRLHEDPLAAGRSGPRGDVGVRLHHELERVHLRQRHPHRPVEPDPHHLALVLLRDEPEHRLGRAHGRVDADRDSRS